MIENHQFSEAILIALAFVPFHQQKWFGNHRSKSWAGFSDRWFFLETSVIPRKEAPSSVQRRFSPKECDGVTLHLKKRMDQLEMKLREHTDDSLHSFEARVSQDLQVALSPRCLRAVRAGFGDQEYPGGLGRWIFERFKVWDHADKPAGWSVLHCWWKWDV